MKLLVLNNINNYQKIIEKVIVNKHYNIYVVNHLKFNKVKLVLKLSKIKYFNFKK